MFEDPFTFDVNRTPNEQIAFGGGGAHYCLGANLAKMELRLIFQEIIERMPDIHRVGEPEWLRSNFIGGVKHLPVRLDPRRKGQPRPRPRPKPVHAGLKRSTPPQTRSVATCWVATV